MTLDGAEDRFWDAVHNRNLPELIELRDTINDLIADKEEDLKAQGEDGDAQYEYLRDEGKLGKIRK